MLLTCRLILATSVFSLALWAQAAPQHAAPNVTYKAFGTFTEPPISGNDVFRLQGEPFSINVVANSAQAPIHFGNGYAVYSPLQMTGGVKSGLLSAPTNLNSFSASVELQRGPLAEVMTLASPIKVVGLTLTINAVINLPSGTLTNLHVHPFAPLAMTPDNATLSYSNGTETTVLGINGTLAAIVDAPPPPTARLSLEGGESQVRHEAPDAVLRFYSRGVRYAADIRA